MSFAILFPNIDPVIFHIIGPIDLRWYSLAYICGIILGFHYLKYLSKGLFNIGKKIFDEILTYTILGIIIGGRLGYVIFYDLIYYVHNPLKILATWNGGMSFHGGIIGFTLAIYLYSYKHKLDFLRLIDLLACVAPIGLFFGRIANFINAELYGKVTSVSWGVIFPGQSLPRHPSQIYEALTEGLLNFAILSLLFFLTKIKFYRGALSGSFLFIYSISRITIEFYREPDIHIGYILPNITTGQILSIPMLILSFFFLKIAYKDGYRI